MNLVQMLTSFQPAKSKPRDKRVNDPEFIRSVILACLPASARQIATRGGMGESTVRTHITKMIDSNLIKSVKSGKRIIYETLHTKG